MDDGMVRCGRLRTPAALFITLVNHSDVTFFSR
jgi:hypothetical protein